MTGALLAATAVALQVANIEPPILTGNDQSMEQYESFRAHVTRDGPFDMIVFGNSMGRQAINPAVLRSELERRSQNRLIYNYASGGTSAAMLPYQIELAHGIDRPPHSIIVLSLRHTGHVRRDLDDRLEIVRTSPYGSALADPLRWRGRARRWLLDKVAVYGLRYSAKELLLGTTPESRKRGSYTGRYGYRVARQRRPEDLDWEARCAQSPNWQPAGETKMAELSRTIRLLQERGSTVTLVQAAIHPRLVECLPGSSATVEAMRQVIRDLAEQTGAHALIPPDSLELLPEEFTDINHLNVRGARKYTMWLGEALISEQIL